MKQLMLLVEESQVSAQAKKMGLEYMKFGRWGKKGKVTHKSEKGKLVPVSRDEYDPVNADNARKDMLATNDPRVSQMGKPPKTKTFTFSPDRMMQVDGKIWNKLHARSGNDIYDKPENWNRYRDAVAQMFKGHSPVTQKALDALENENHHALIAALAQNGLIDKKAPYYNNPYLMNVGNPNWKKDLVK